MKSRDDVSIIRDLSIFQDRCKVCHEFHVSQCNGSVRDERWTRRFAMTFVEVGSPESRDTWYVLLLEKRWITNYTWLRSLLNLLRKVSEPIFRVQILQSCGEEWFTPFRSVFCKILDLLLNYVTSITKSVIHVFFFSLKCSAGKTKWSWWVLIYVLLVNWRYDHFYTINLWIWNAEVDLGI